MRPSFRHQNLELEGRVRWFAQFNGVLPEAASGVSIPACHGGYIRHRQCPAPETFRPNHYLPELLKRLRNDSGMVSVEHASHLTVLSSGLALRLPSITLPTAPMRSRASSLPQTTPNLRHRLPSRMPICYRTKGNHSANYAALCPMLLMKHLNHGIVPLLPPSNITMCASRKSTVRDIHTYIHIASSTHVNYKGEILAACSHPPIHKPRVSQQ